MNNEALTVTNAQPITSVWFNEPAIGERKEMILAESALIGSVRNATTQDVAVATQVRLKTMLKEIEDARIEIKEPFLDRCRKIDATAKALALEVAAEEKRIGNLVSAYQEEQREIARREEVMRQHELQRIENERLERISEANRKAQQAAIAEAKAKEEAERAAREAAAAEARRKEEADRAIREAANAEARAQAEAAAKIAEAAAVAARVKAEGERIAAEARAAEARAQAEAEARAAEAEAQRRVDAVPVPVVPMKSDGQVVKERWTFEVVDIWLLAKMHPGFVRIDVNKQEINEAINRGIREIKGLRIFKETKSGVRADRGQKLIEV